MASDHLRITIEFISGGPLRQRGLLLYSPSTVRTLKEELSHAHGVPASDIVVYFDGVTLEDKTRMVDKRMYHVRLPPKWVDPLAGGVDLGLGLGRGVVGVEKGVTFEEGVHVDSMVVVKEEPKLDAKIYMAFAHSGVVQLFDVASGLIMSPTPFLQLGYSVIYADWARLRPLTKGLTVEPMTWLYDRLRRDYGIPATSSVFGLHTAPLAELRRYRSAVEANPAGGKMGELEIVEAEEEEWNQLEEWSGEEGEEGEEEEREAGEESEEDDWKMEEVEEMWR